MADKETSQPDPETAEQEAVEPGQDDAQDHVQDESTAETIDETGGEGAEAAEEDSGSLPDNLDDALAALATASAAADTARDQSLRAVAEMENLRRRAARDVENAHKFALEKFVKALVPVVESMERAETALGESAPEAAGGETADAVLEGVGLSVKLFKDTLEKQGVTQLDPHGEPFNPEHHEAIAMVPMPAMEPNSVIEVMRKGYLLNGRLIQAAQVVVSQGDGSPAAKSIDEKA